jgi:hypothetical protein
MRQSSLIDQAPETLACAARDNPAADPCAGGWKISFPIPAAPAARGLRRAPARGIDFGFGLSIGRKALNLRLFHTGFGKFDQIPRRSAHACAICLKSFQIGFKRRM